MKDKNHDSIARLLLLARVHEIATHLLSPKRFTEPAPPLRTYADFHRAPRTIQ